MKNLMAALRHLDTMINDAFLRAGTMSAAYRPDFTKVFPTKEEKDRACPNGQ